MTLPHEPGKKQYANISTAIVNFYWPDDYIYVVYKLANIEKLAEKSLLDFEYLRSPGKSNMTPLGVLNILYQHLNIEIEGFVFHKDIFQKYRRDEFDRLQRRITFAEDNYEMAQKLFNSTFTLKDVVEDPFTFSNHGAGEFIEFNAALPKDTSAKIQACLNNYMEAYIAQTLKVDRENITIFSEQKRLFAMLLNSLSKKYGDSFIITDNDVNAIREEQEYFLHNLVAFERLGYINIIDLDIMDREKSIISQGEEYQAKIEVLPAFKKLVSQPKKGSATSYSFRDYDPPSGELKIGDFPEMPFSKIPAIIVNYFYNLNKFDKTTKNYQDFNAFIQSSGRRITSNDFRLRINEINEKVKKTTGGLISEAIIREEGNGSTAKKESNSYKWNNDIT